MKFEQTKPTINFPVVRMQSNTWEFGIRQMLFGFRVSANPLDSDCYTIDYCAGDDQRFVLELFLTIWSILDSLPDSTTAAEVSSIIPKTQIKPVKNDPSWPLIKNLAIQLQSQNQWETQGEELNLMV